MAAPIWNTPAGNIGSVVEGSSFSFVLSASNDAGLPFTYSLISGDLPPGLTLDAPTGTVYGTVPLLLSGSLYTFTIRATNVDGISDRTFSITVIQQTVTWNTPANLGTVIHESYFSLILSASDPGDTNLTYSLISGQLPGGLEFQTNGFISGYLSQITDNFDTYNFTIRANGAVPEDRTFTLVVTSLGVHSPQWNTISAYDLGNGLEGGNLGNIFNNVSYEFQLKSVKPNPGGPGNISYNLVSGFFPPGISMTSSGYISGTLTSQAVSIYPLIIQITDGLNTVSAVFYIKTNFVDSDLIYWVVDSSTIPVDLSIMAEQETDSFNVGTSSYQITKTGEQTTFDQKLVDEILINDNLNQQDSLIVVLQSTGTYTIYRYYSGLVYDIFTLTAITPGDYIFTLGSIDVGQSSTFNVSAISLSQWVRYELISGSLPAGLSLNISTGDIEGSAQPQTSQTYTFKLRAYNFTLTQDLVFGISVSQPAVYKGDKLTTRVGQFGKIDWYNLKNQNLIANNDIYRPSDYEFGMNTSPEVVIISELDQLTAEQVFDTISQVVPTTLHTADFIYTPVTDENGLIICEALLLRMKDNFRRSAVSYDIPEQKNPSPNQPVTIYPGGLEAIRQTFINSGTATDALENWQNFYFKTDLINNQFIINGILPEFYTGDAISFHGQTLPNPFENDLYYYVIPINSTTFKLASSESNAEAGIAIDFNVNETEEQSGTLQFFFPAMLLCYLKTGNGSAIMQAYNNQQNIVPFSYYTMGTNSFTDTFFTTLYGHNLNTGDPIQFWDEPLPSPFVFGYIYYAIVIDSVTLKLALTKADAINGNAVSITGTIDDRTNMPMSGSFKKLLLTDNNTVIVNEANTRFSIPVEILYVDSRYKFKPFTATASNGYFNLPKHGLYDGGPLDFYNQMLESPFLNDVVYYAIVIDEDNFQLAASEADVQTGTNISFAADFSAYLNLDTARPVFINSINQFETWATHTNNILVTTQTSPWNVGDIVQLVQTKTAIPSELSTGTNYYVIPMSNGNSLRLASSLTNAQNGSYITFSADFIANIKTMSNASEYDWRRK